ncbi:MAG: phosphatidylinositol mannoside acyltransferase [Egibacteraceae bacterium]
MSSRRYRGSGRRGEPVDRRRGAEGRIPAPRRPERAAERARGVLWSGVWELARRLPEPVAFGLADLAGRLAHRLAPATRRRVRANLAHVVDADDLDATVAAAFRSYARYWVEAFRAADLDPGDLDRRTTTDGFAHLDAALEADRGVIVLLAHHGSWDIAARWAESHRYHLAVVAEVVRPRAVFRRFVRLREDIGLEVLPLHRDGDVTARLVRVLEANHLVGLLTDRDLTGRAPEVTLFGGRTRVPLGPAVLSRRTGAPIVPITLLQRPGRCWHLQVLPAIEPGQAGVRELHAAVLAALEALIGLEPAQWHAFQPVFGDAGPAGPSGEDGLSQTGGTR